MIYESDFYYRIDVIYHRLTTYIGKRISSDFPLLRHFPNISIFQFLSWDRDKNWRNSEFGSSLAFDSSYVCLKIHHFWWTKFSPKIGRAISKLETLLEKKYTKRRKFKVKFPYFHYITFAWEKLRKSLMNQKQTNEGIQSNWSSSHHWSSTASEFFILIVLLW